MLMRLAVGDICGFGGRPITLPWHAPDFLPQSYIGAEITHTHSCW